MTREQKAKAYDEALNWMRELYPGLHGATKKDAEHYFPELKESKESEDERIRRSIVTIVEQYARVCEKEGDPCEASLIDDALSYLEKQKERGPLTKEEEYTLHRIIEYLEDEACPSEWISLLHDIYCLQYEKQKEQIPYIDFVIKPHKGDDTNPYDMSVSEAQDYATNRGFDIPFNDGEVYVDERHITQTIGNILRWADEHPKEQKPAEWSEEDTKRIKQLIYDTEAIREGYEKRKKQLGACFNEALIKDCDEQIAWLKALKDRGNFPKSNTNSPSEWSEKDEDTYNRVYCLFRDAIDEWYKAIFSGCYPKITKDKVLAMLKFLRPQLHWKPSEEQMEALSETIAFAPDTFKPKCTLVTLQDDLKKLMEE